jgi:hypothetical protein
MPWRSQAGSLLPSDPVGFATPDVAFTPDHAVSVRSVAIDMSVEATPRLRMYRHGYQSWSPSDVAVLGVDYDPSIHGGAEIVRAMQHADQRVVDDDPGILRSEWLTVLADGAGAAALVAFDGAGDHDGTLWLSRRDDIRLRAEASLGGISMEPGETRHDLQFIEGHAGTLTDGESHRALPDDTRQTDCRGPAAGHPLYRSTRWGDPWRLNRAERQFSPPLRVVSCVSNLSLPGFSMTPSP